MRRRLVGVTLAIAAALAVSAPAQAAKDPLNAFRVKATPENKQRLAAEGFDLTEGDHGKYIEIYATGRQARGLRADGVATKRITSITKAADPSDYTGSDAAWDVWTRYDAVPGDGKEQYEEQYDRVAAKPFVKKESLGTTHLGRPIWAVKVTKNADTEPDNPSRPCSTTRSSTPASGWPARPAAGPSTSSSTTTARHAGRRRTPPSSSTPASCGSSASRTPTATSTRSRPATGCGARTWPTTTATACSARRGRGRPEPQLRHQLGPRQRGLLGRPVERDVPRQRPGLRARDQGDEGAVGHGRLRVPEERPHGVRAAAVSAGLPAVHADAGQRHLRGAGR